MDLKNFTGDVAIDSGQVRLKQTAFTIIDAPVTMAALYKPTSAASAYFDYNIKADSFSIQKAYKEIRLFRELATAAEKAEGIVSLDYHLNGRLDANMYPVYPSLKGGGALTLDKIKVKGLKLFGAVSKETNKNINDPELSKVVLKTTIQNNLIKLERTKMRIAGFRPRIEGEMSFDGKMNLAFRLGLPPFGIIGIPLTVTGTQDDPKVHIRRARKGDKLEEVQDVDESEKEEP
jgi:AsmA protein